MNRYWRNLFRFSVLSSFLGAIFLTTGLFYLQIRGLLTVKRKPVLLLPGGINFTLHQVELTAPDGVKVAGWYVPGSRPQGLVLVHGIDNNRTALLSDAKILHEAGYHLLLIDLRGHGNSGDAPLTYGYYESLDVLAGVDYLDSLPEVEQIGAIGHSLGGASVVRAAAVDERLKVMVIHSSFASLNRAIEDGFDKMSLLPRWPTAPLTVAIGEYYVGVSVTAVDSMRDLAAMEDRPVLIIHGTRDHLFPDTHGRLMYEAAAGPKALWLVEGMDHVMAAEFAPEAYRAEVLPFLEAAWE